MDRGILIIGAVVLLVGGIVLYARRASAGVPYADPYSGLPIEGPSQPGANVGGGLPGIFPPPGMTVGPRTAAATGIRHF